jgi:Flp pilus assembly protein TadD
MKGGQNEKARAVFERAIALKPDFAEASNGLGALLGQSGNLPGAIARFQTALDTAPDYPDALNNLGYALLQSNRDGRLTSCSRARAATGLRRGSTVSIHAARRGDPPQAQVLSARRSSFAPATARCEPGLWLWPQRRAGAIFVSSTARAEPGFEMSYIAARST